MRSMPGAVLAGLFLFLLHTSPGMAQMSATITLERQDSNMPRQRCEPVVRSMPDGLETSLLTVRIVESDTVTKAPTDLKVHVRGRTLALAKETSDTTVTVDTLANEWVDIQTGDGTQICSTQLPREVPPSEPENPLEVDNAFRLMAGLEFLSADGFDDRALHVPISAQWQIPLAVSVDGTRYGNIYSILTGAAEFTSFLSRRTFLTCVPAVTGEETIEKLCSTADDTGFPGFQAREDSASYYTPGAWRIYGRYRREFNLSSADGDVYLGPVLVAGFQTDPGLRLNEFFPIGLVGASLTQVQITPDYYEERFQIQLLWGKSANYAERVVTRVDSTTETEDLEVPATGRWHVLMNFQPVTGYFVRGAAEFGPGVPDIARFSVETAVNVERLVRSIFGGKDPLRTPR